MPHLTILCYHFKVLNAMGPVLAFLKRALHCSLDLHAHIHTDIQAQITTPQSLLATALRLMKREK